MDSPSPITPITNPIRLLREQRGWSMVRAAGLANMALNTWKQLENRPLDHTSFTTLYKAACALGVAMTVRFDSQVLYHCEEVVLAAGPVAAGPEEAPDDGAATRPR
jgi:transcriptional regulator with XRE-family HTH domain